MSSTRLPEWDLMLALDEALMRFHRIRFVAADKILSNADRVIAMTCHVGLLIITFAVAYGHAEETKTISKVDRDANGFLVHRVQSSCQAGTTLIRLLLPDNLDPDQKRGVVFVLPVEAEMQKRYGDGLLEIKQQNLHNKSGLIFVAPTFSHLPWYADHPSSPEIRQEAYFLEVVVPFVDANYPVKATAEERHLLGFSKSGWGAWSLLLRHRDKFGKAVAWDAPLMMDQPGKYGSGPIFGTTENFEQYHISSLLKQHSQELRREPRLILLGYGNFRSEHQQAHALMNQLMIPHAYRDGPQRKHDWHSGWVKEAVELMVERPE